MLWSFDGSFSVATSLAGIVSLIKWMTEPACLPLGWTVTSELMNSEICILSTWYVFCFLSYRSIYHIWFKGGWWSIPYTEPPGKDITFHEIYGLYTRMCFQHNLEFDWWVYFCDASSAYQHPSSLQMCGRYCPMVPGKEYVEKMEKTWEKHSNCRMILQLHEKGGTCIK